MKRIAFAIIAFGIFLWEFLNIVVAMQWVCWKHTWQGFIHCLIMYHNRVQNWADDGRSLFEMDEHVEEEEQ